MKIAAWNCRGLGNRSAVRGLLGFQKAEEVDMLFLSETKQDEKGMRRFRRILIMGDMVVVDSVGKGGELQCCGGGGSMRR